MIYRIFTFLLILQTQNIFVRMAITANSTSSEADLHDTVEIPSLGSTNISTSSIPNESSRNPEYISEMRIVIDPQKRQSTPSAFGLNTSDIDISTYPGGRDEDLIVPDTTLSSEVYNVQESDQFTTLIPDVTTNDNKFVDENTIYLKYEVFKNHDKNYVHIAPVNCETKDGQSLDASSDVDDFSDMTHGGADIVSEIKTLALLERSLYELYNMAVKTSKNFACDLDIKVGKKAINMSSKYVKERGRFLKKLTNIINHTDRRNMTSDIEFLNSEFVEKTLYEKNLNFTRNMTEMLNQLCFLVEAELEIKSLSVDVNKHIEDYDKIADITVLSTLVAGTRKLRELNSDFLDGAEYITDMLKHYDNLNNIFSTPNTLKLLDLESREDQVNKIKIEEEVYIYRLDGQKTIAEMYEKAEFILLGATFIVGIISNGILVVMFMLHKELRTTADLMLLNLAIADIFSLVVNIPVFYTTDGNISDIVCKVYQFIRSTCVGVSVYTIVMISYQRFVAMSVISMKSWCLASYPRALYVPLFVWFVSIILALPHGFIAGVKSDGSCYGIQPNEPIYQLGVTLFDVLSLCTIPVFLITVIIGFTVEESKFKPKVNLLSYNIVVGLVVVFVMTYLPYYLFRFAFVWSGMKIDTLSYVYVFVGIHTLIFINSCLNPIAVYIVSKRYRGYIVRTLLCQKGSSMEIANTELSAGVSTTTVESTMF